MRSGHRACRARARLGCRAVALHRPPQRRRACVFERPEHFRCICIDRSRRHRVDIHVAINTKSVSAIKRAQCVRRHHWSAAPYSLDCPGMLATVCKCGSVQPCAWLVPAHIAGPTRRATEGLLVAVRAGLSGLAARHERETLSRVLHGVREGSRGGQVAPTGC